MENPSSDVYNYGTCIYMAESSDVMSSLAKYITKGYVAIVN